MKSEHPKRNITEHHMKIARPGSCVYPDLMSTSIDTDGHPARSRMPHVCLGEPILPFYSHCDGHCQGRLSL